MSTALDSVVRTILYEGYALYPYRPTALKNRQRWMFGIVYPAGGDPSSLDTQCLVEAAPEATLEIRFRCLRLGAPPPGIADTWDQAEEVTLPLPCTALRDKSTIETPFTLRERAGWPALHGRLHAAIEELSPGLYRITTGIENQTPAPDVSGEAALRSALISTHAILSVLGGSFVSLQNPPEHLAAAVAACRNRALWPVLAGDERTLLASPVILYDHPRIAPESGGDFFDGTEIDEMLALRILTLTDAEKAEMRAADERTRHMLERIEAMSPAELRSLHGAQRPTGRPAHALAPGMRVRVNPRPGGDIWDLLLRGKDATVECVEEDFEGRLHVAVVVDDDPGRDLGLDKQTGHRFFYSPEELEPL